MYNYSKDGNTYIFFNLLNNHFVQTLFKFDTLLSVCVKWIFSEYKQKSCWIQTVACALGQSLDVLLRRDDDPVTSSRAPADFMETDDAQNIYHNSPDLLKRSTESLSRPAWRVKHTSPFRPDFPNTCTMSSRGDKQQDISVTESKNSMCIIWLYLICIFTCLIANLFCTFNYYFLLQTDGKPHLWPWSTKPVNAALYASSESWIK